MKEIKVNSVFSILNDILHFFGMAVPTYLISKVYQISFKNRNCFSDKKSPISFYRYGIHFNYYWFLQLVPMFAMNFIGSY